ncbi:MAG TPA: STAS/SEC14 domain-containing protein [Rhodocyclaceae bacterium]|nr:STAS/SEC14 domain-containing protein [Rhodocyclaceae bacterium]
MITTEVFSDRIEMRAFGEFSLADFKTLESLSDYRIRFNGPIDLLLDFRDMAGFTIDVVLEELRYTKAHAKDFARIAVLSEDQWVTWGSWLSQFFVQADIRVFDDEEPAREWLGEAERMPFSAAADSLPSST